MKSKFRFLFTYYSFIILAVITGIVSLAFFTPSSPEVPKLAAPTVPVDKNNGLNTDSETAMTEGVTSEQLVVTPDYLELNEAITKSGDKIKYNSLKLVDNEWGAPANEQLVCAVFLNQGQNFGWNWNRQDPKLKPGSSGILPIYPSVRIGGNHREQSDIAHFPIKMSDLKSLSFMVDYRYPEIPTGVFDLAYDMFLLNTDNSGPEAERKSEVMIWLHGTLGQPLESYKGDFSDGYNTYSLYSFTMSDGRLYSSFILKGQPQFQSRHYVDVKKLLDYIDLDPNWYIPGIELGNEVVNGSGKIEISQISVNLNGSDIVP